MISNNEISEFKNIINQILLEGDEAPENRTIKKIKELSSIQDLEMSLINKNLLLHIPNHKLHEIFEVVPKNMQSRNYRFMIANLLIGIIGSLTFFLLGDYWLLAGFPVAFITFTIISGQVGRLYPYLFFLAAIVLFVINMKTLAILIGIHAISIWGGQQLRKHRRKSLIEMALQDEEIFWFLFNAQVLSVFDPRNNKLYRKGSGL